MTTIFPPLVDRMLSMSRALDDVIGQSEQTQGSPWSGSGRALWYPPIDTYETAKAFVVQCDLPGVDPDQVELHFERNTLTIAGSRRAPFPASEQKDAASREELRVYSAERVWGPFTRSLRMPEHVDGEKIDAAFANGVLTVSIPKAPSALPRKIEVKAAGAGNSNSRLNA
ncbi:MAG: Hsp20/alpha crystallin family protein [Gemmatimonadaceae bacterium]